MERVKVFAALAVSAAVLAGCTVYTAEPARPAYVYTAPAVVYPAPGYYYAAPAYGYRPYPYRVWR